MTVPNTRDPHSIAITGLSCRFPGDGDNLESFWESICKGGSAWSEIPKDRFNVDAFYSPSRNRNTSITRGAHFIKQNIAQFDANFFSFSKTEATSMDPQHRMMIEVAYEALEKAGLPLHEIAGTRTGVFMGHFTGDYRDMIYRDSESAPPYTGSGATKTSLANRISWLFDLKGPSFTMDTACSSSLVALHLACQSLRTGESDMAIVGGTNLMLNPEMFMYFSSQHFLSPDGRCKSFDESGDGYGRGEGFACVILKRVDDAVANGDPIRAVIRGTASNQDGHTKGFTLPSADAQAALIQDTYRWAGLDFQDTNYVEAHGTGTQAGDTEETQGISRTISAKRPLGSKLLVGSVKSNIGHLEAVAGLAAVVKSVLILENGLIPPTIHFRKGNPRIKFDEWHIQIPTTLTPWPTNGLRRLSTNSFGYGGTNAHAILDDAYHYLKSRGLQGNHYTKVGTRHIGEISAVHNGHDEAIGTMNGINGVNGTQRTVNDLNDVAHHRSPRLFVLSAADKEGLKRVKLPLAEFLKDKSTFVEDEDERSQTYMADLAYTLSQRRSQLQWKTYGIASSLEELSEVLKDEESEALVSRSSRQPRIGFVFTGQGAQWPRMGAELIEYEIFRESVKAADKYLRSECGCQWSAMEELQKGKSTSQLHLAAYSQTLCTVLQVALVDLLKTWCISPVAVAGHSSGEIGAAYCLGALSKEDAWKIAYWRGLLSSGMKVIAPEVEGSMMAVGSSPEQAEAWISKVTKGEVVVACVNSPSSVTLSGDTAGIDELLSILKTEGIFARKLQVDTAYHSPHMQMVAQEYFEAIADVIPLTPTGPCKMHSSVIGRIIEPTELGAANWVRNLTSSVQFATAIYDMMRPLQNGQRASENAVDIIVEVGPHSALQGPATQTLKAYGITNIPYHSVISRNQSGINTALGMAGALFAQGYPVDICQANNDAGRGKKPLIDLPMYPWNHSQTFWAESRVGKEYRLREQPRLSLIGAPTPTFGEGERLWRGFIRLSEEPWIADHKIQGSILYPGAGFLAMAFEAASQTADKKRQIAAFRLRDIQLTAAAVISEESDLECIVQLRPHIIGTREHASTWTEFIVTTSADSQNLQRNCSGLLIIDYEPAQGSDNRRERDFENESSKGQYMEAAQLCTTHVTPADFYKDLTAMGLIYGPSFANLTEIRSTGGQSFCAVDIPDIPTRIIEGLQTRPHVIHPGTLDAIFHMAFAAVKGGDDNLMSPMVPRSIDEVIVSADIPYEPGTRLTGFSNAAKHGFKELKADIIMLDEQATHPLVQIIGFRCAEVGGGSSSAENDETAAKKICSKLTWKPAIEVLSPEEQRLIVDRASSVILDDDIKLNIGKAEASALDHIDQILNAVSKDDVVPALQEFYGWMKQQRDLIQAQTHPLQAVINHRAGCGESFKSDSTISDTLNAIKIRLESLLLGKTDNNDASKNAGSLYLETEGVKAILRKLTEYLKLLHHTNPKLSILEIGSGSGDPAPTLLLPELHGLETVLRTAEYTVSCQNSAALSIVEDRLSSFQEGVKCEVLDIDGDLATHELKDRKFDVIIGFNISGTVRDPDVALINAKKLLKPGGEVCLVETTNPGMYLSLLRSSTVPKVNTLEPLLQRNGFVNKMTLDDFGDAQFQQLSLLIGTTDEAPEVSIDDREVILIENSNPSKTAKAAIAQLAIALEKLSYKPRSFVWGSDVSSLKNKSCIALMELESPLLSTLTEQDFSYVKRLVLESASTFWVVGTDDPSGAMVAGLARVVRNETPGLSFRTLHIDAKALTAPENLGAIVVRVFQSPTADDEFMVNDGIVNISRIEEDVHLNEELERLLPNAGKKIDKIALGQASGAQKLCVQTPGMLDSLCFEPDDSPYTDLEDEKIEIYVKATALNFREVMSVMGQIPDALLGFDASGIVRRVGSAVTKFKIGDRVAMYGHGSHRTIHRSRADYCELIPEGLSFEQAATIPVVHGTAWYGLVQLARVRKGQSILIHAAAGGVGQAAIQIAKHHEMEIFATVGSEVKRKLLRENYGIPDDHMFNSRDYSFVKGVKRMTKGRGVDVILNSLSGEALRQTWYCIAPFGTFLEIGIKDILGNTELDMRPFLQDATFAFFNLNHIEKERPDIMAEIIKGAFDFQRRGITSPITPLVTYPVSEVENAFRLMQTGKHLGKIALSFNDDDVVPMVQTGASSLKLDKDAAYLLVGGLGGLGRSISAMLVDHGARKLCFLSRSGGKSAEAQKLIRDLESKQVEVQTYPCDVADEKAVAEAVAQCSEKLGPIRGVLQCAMLLRDTLFTNMSYEQWTESTRPKVQGSWNLHQNLKSVDFFIVLSSFAAIFGNRGQSNYAAAGAYEDAISHYRRSQGLHAVTLDIGLMRDIGVLAEKGITDSLREWEEPYGIRATEFHALLKRAIAGDIAGDLSPQVITGLATGGSAIAAGISTPFYLEDPRFSIMSQTGVRDQSAAANDNGIVSTQALVAQSTSLAEAAGHVTEALVNRVAKMLQTASSEIDTGRFLHSYGIDSLVAIEIVNWALKETKSNITVFDVMAGVPITSTASKIAARSSILPKGLVAN